MTSTLDIRHERVRTRATRGARLLYASDLHLGWPWTRNVPSEILDAVRSTAPDALLLGGDLCDSERALTQLTSLVRAAREFAPVLAVPGNHDLRLGPERVRAAIVSAGGTWLVDGLHRIGGLTVEGRALSSVDPTDCEATSLRVLCAHRPAIIAAARRARFDVVLAGHLHGGQLVLFERRGRLYPYAWIDRWCGPRFDLDGTTLLVSRGAGDTLPLRFRCPREVLLCDLVPA